MAEERGMKTDPTQEYPVVASRTVISNERMQAHDTMSMTKTLDPTKEYTHVCKENSEVVLDFPAGTVKSKDTIRIMLEPTRKVLTPLTEVACFSDVVCIQHSNEFLKPVKVKLPLTVIGKNHIETCDLFCVHIGDDDEIEINENVDVNILNGNMCCFEAIDFSSNAVAGRKKSYRKKGNPVEFRREVLSVYGPRPHNILLFVGTGTEEDTWTLHAEVVEQQYVDSTIRKRQIERDLSEIVKCRSPSLGIRKTQQIEVTLGSQGCLAFCNVVKKGRIVINMVPDATDNFISFTVMKKSQPKTAAVYFQILPKNRNIHSAFFDSQVMNRLRYKVTPDREAAEKISHNISKRGSSRPTSEIQTFDFFGDRSMLCLTMQITQDKMWELSIFLGISDTTYRDLERKYQENSSQLKLNILKHWLESDTCSDETRVSTLCNSLKQVKLNRIANIVERAFTDNRTLEDVNFSN